ncbi:SagB/ThcOx family dehydrogenase [Candidatus Bathyarchaeota archaeon]|nr:SagB/ThcOx family dehydrogenase [Candidatus Bathyarchaeota archaeon]
MVRGTGREFMEKTKYKYLDESDQVKGLPQPPLTLPPVEGKPVHRLLDPGEVPRRAVDLWDAINNRVSVRAYSEEPLSLEELSYMLWCTQGVKEATGRAATLRTVPSAGARHCFETYLLVNRVEGLKQGVYRFLATEHSLQEVDTEPGVAEKVTQACYNQRFVMQSAATFIWTAVAYRMMWRYGERGYRYMHLDAGHVCQNLYLAAEAIGCGACAIAAFHDDALNEVLRIDGVEQFAVYIGVLGKKRG